jgi:hypothetical protein
MTDNIDDRLQFALTQFDNNAPLGSRWQTVVQRIKDTFKSEGYMTGQEWYNRFIAELDKSVDVNRKTQDFTDGILAAKRAAEVE